MLGVPRSTTRPAEATNWSSVDETDAYNDEVIVAITEVIAGKKIPTENYLILQLDLFRLNAKQTRSKNYGGERCDPSPFTIGRRTGEEEGEGP